MIALGRTQEAERGLEEALSMSESFGDLSFPALTAAGAAVHLGLGARGITIAELAVESGNRMGADGAEARVTLALALCQDGRADDALVVLDEVEREFPYGSAVAALVGALTGDALGAIEQADNVVDDPEATYLDVVIAVVAAAASEARLGDRDASACRLERGAAPRGRRRRCRREGTGGGGVGGIGR